LSGGHSQRAKSERQEQEAQKGNPDLGRRQQEAELERNIGADLKDRQIMILEPVVDICLRQRREKSRQQHAAEEIDQRHRDRECARVSIDQQDQRIERITRGLDRQHLTAANGAALQQVGCELAIGRKPRLGLWLSSDGARLLMVRHVGCS
jgi:hypothetical protein